MVTAQPEIIMYRGEEINVTAYREGLMHWRNQDGTPYYTPEQIERQVQKGILREKRLIGRYTGARFEKHSGFHLAFYEEEHKLFPEAYSTKVSDAEAEKIVRKLLRHFGFSVTARNVHVRFYGNRQTGACGWDIRLSHNPTVGLVCHEVSHKFHTRHDKKLTRWMKRMIAYCYKKNLWRTEEND